MGLPTMGFPLAAIVEAALTPGAGPNLDVLCDLRIVSFNPFTNFLEFA